MLLYVLQKWSIKAVAKLCTCIYNMYYVAVDVNFCDIFIFLGQFVLFCLFFFRKFVCEAVRVFVTFFLNF